jgi:hypothetical protein
MSQNRVPTWPKTPGYDNPSRNKGDLANKSEDRSDPKPNKPIGHPSDQKLGQKPPAKRTPPS